MSSIGISKSEINHLTRLAFLLYTSSFYDGHIRKFEIVLKHFNSNFLKNGDVQVGVFTSMIHHGNIVPLVRLLEYMIEKK